MCKNLTAFVAGVFTLSFLGLGARMAIVDQLSGAHITAVCPACTGVFWLAAFAMPLLVGLFIGAFGSSRAWFCSGSAALLALVIRTLLVGPGLVNMLHSPALIGLSVLYVGLAMLGGLIGVTVTSPRRVTSPVEQKETAQSHSHDNMAF